MASSSNSGTTISNYRRGRNAGRGIPLRCHCGEMTVMRTSNTPTNPGRLFHVCPFRSEENKGHLFKWTDESIVEEVEDMKVGLQIIGGDVARMGMGSSSFIRNTATVSEPAPSPTVLSNLTRELEELKATVMHIGMEITNCEAKLLNMKKFVAVTIAFVIAYSVFFG